MIDEGVEGDTGAGLDSSSAMLRAEAEHLDAMLQALVWRLSSVPGLQMTVSRRHGRLRRLVGDLPYVNDLHRRTDPISAIAVTVGSSAYSLHTDAGAIRCERRSSPSEGGPAPEQLPFSVWAPALFDRIAQQNYINHESLVALRHLVEQDRVD